MSFSFIETSKSFLMGDEDDVAASTGDIMPPNGVAVLTFIRGRLKLKPVRKPYQ
jgi:hypothetical protein